MHRLLSEEACSSQWHAVETGMLGRGLLRQPANHSGDIVSMTPTRSSDPAFEELVLARAEEGRDRWRRWHRQLASSAFVGQGGRLQRWQAQKGKHGGRGGPGRLGMHVQRAAL